MFYLNFILKKNLKLLVKPNLNRQLTNKISTKTEHLKPVLDKINSLPIKINTNYLDINTLNRLDKCSTNFIIEVITILNEYGIKDKHLSLTLKNYDDWSLLSKENVYNVWNSFRELSIKNEIYSAALSTNTQIINIDKKFLINRLKNLNNFFTNKHLDRILIKAPNLLTNNFDLFRYKFTYIYALMGIDQEEMCSSYVFNHTIEHIRERHLFLLRSMFYDKPNKKGQTKIENQKLPSIVDSNLKEYLKICTKNKLNEKDYFTFCDYLKQENFNNELLGLRIERVLRNQIIDSIQKEKKIERNFY